MGETVKRPRKQVHLATTRFHPARRPSPPAAAIPAGAPVDGRLQRAWQTRRRIVESMMEIVRTTGMQPTMAEVARVAGVSLRALFVHFPDLQSLVRAGSDLVRERAAKINESISPDGPLAARIADYVAYRAAYFEAMGKVWRVGFLLAQSFPEVRANRAGYRDRERMRLGQIFAKELRPLAGPVRARRMAALMAVSDFHFWEGLHEAEGLDAVQAAPVVEETMLAILTRR